MQKGSQETQEEVYSLDKFALKFKSKMSEYIFENKDLSSKVSSGQKGYGMLKIMEIIAKYNEDFGK